MRGKCFEFTTPWRRRDLGGLKLLLVTCNLVVSHIITARVAQVAWTPEEGRYTKANKRMIRRKVFQQSKLFQEGVHWNTSSVLSRIQDACSKERTAVFFAEDAADWIHIGPIANRLEELDHSIIRLTSDPNDPEIFSHDAIYIGRTLYSTYLFLRLPSCILVTTMTDLNSYHLKRSLNDVHYVYVFHSLLSTHRAYRENAFTAYDTVLCSTPYHTAELTETARLANLKPQHLLETGYCRLDPLIAHAASNPISVGRPPKILVVPTWGSSSILNFNIDQIIQSLLGASLEVVLRLHPMSLRHDNGLSQYFSEKFKMYSLFSLDDSFSSTDAFTDSDIVLTDWSGAAYEFSLGLLRPAIFIDTPPKTNNDTFSRLNLSCFEDSIRDTLGALIGLDQLDGVPEVVMHLLESDIELEGHLRTLRDDTVYNPGTAVATAARQIGDLLS